jgi:uncharacterized protein (TIGR02266 family)
MRCWCEGDNVTFYARVANVSEGGLYLQTSTPLKGGARAQVRLERHGDLAFRAEATVMWSRPGSESSEGLAGMGLRFESLGPSQADQLRQLLQAEKGAGKGTA